MIAGYGMHGLGDKALQTFNRMIVSGFEPDGVTFVACLSSCIHAGLVSKGREIFDQMDGEFKFEPQLEHYSCMVDLLGRAGFLKEAYNMVKTMAMEPNICVLGGGLLNSCSMYKNTDVAQDTASLMIRLWLHVAVKYIRCKRKMGRFCEGENLSKDKGFEENFWLKLDLGEEESVDVFIWGSCGDGDE
ncbi:hypothetical protein POM88_012965 [Heracleum sosnowskyi]|uniref:Pentatricopeptide repeat-containing protein n=1 Tax=Heracleum sosnowskyi TaxID=360622 RepID=A0AAD8IXG4_9APIA|nr:hypothetical protein POM88_012965 [Heracleum sosnowskyi]